MRMIIGEILHDQKSNQLRVIHKYRAPVRLGRDVFMNGTISEQTLKEATKAFVEFSELNKENRVQKIRAVATSAVREAKNKNHFVEEIRKKSKIQIEVIDGIEEARLIHLAVHKELDLHKKKIMLIDIGGGSVEITFSENGYMSATKSFPMGTVRILDLLTKRKLSEKDLNLIIGDFLEPLTNHIESQQGSHQLDFAVGTGGNMECMGKLRKQILGKTPTTHLTAKELGQILDEVRQTSVRDRQSKLDMRPDRADVIVPAMMLVQTVMRLSETQRLVIPGVGLRDGLLWSTAGY